MNIYREGDHSVIHMPEHCRGNFGKKLYNLIIQENIKELHSIVFDFTDTKTLDSSMIGTLVSIDKEIKKQNGILTLKNLNDEITELFADTGMDILFNVESSTGLTEAVVDIFKPSVDIRLEIEIEVINDVCIFHLGGIMNHPMGSRYFKQKVLLAMAEHKNILLDFENLTFFDSLSISVVLSMNKLLEETGGQLKFCNTNYIVKDLFTTLNIDHIIPMFDTIDNAMATWI
ncbi:MAG: STAS domain-containing protein [Chitinispirillia bacterium]|jgi:anti-anti-sigma factor